MIGGLKKTTSRLALVAATGFIMGGISLTPATAADLGGDCCADLEERVAELEATTVRKGNRKVSLTISGHVARVIGWMEDHNGDSEFYSQGHGVSGSRIQFAGSAELVRGWTAGYTLRLRFAEDRTSDGMNEAGARSTTDEVEYDRNFVYLKHNRIGTFVAGQAAAPTDGIANISLGGRGVTGDAEGDLWNATPIDGFDLEQGTHQAIAYISPTIAGFTYAVAWADLDDDAVGDAGVDAIDMALRYAKEFGPMRFAAGIGFTTTDHDTNENGVDVDGQALMGSLSLMHVPTGLFASYSQGKTFDSGINEADGIDESFWFVEAGINRDFTGLGNTSIYGEWGLYEADHDNGGIASEITMWGLGVVQHFDKAATELFIAYRHWEDDEDNAGDDDVDQVMAGMRIKF